jgi:hypothetical protein
MYTNPISNIWRIFHVVEVKVSEKLVISVQEYIFPRNSCPSCLFNVFGLRTIACITIYLVIYLVKYCSLVRQFENAEFRGFFSAVRKRGIQRIFLCNSLVLADSILQKSSLVPRVFGKAFDKARPRKVNVCLEGDIVLIVDICRPSSQIL